MKLRIRGNSVRLRLTRGEVAELRARGRVEDAAMFGGGERLVYAIECVEDAEGVRARFDGGCVDVVVPTALAREWIETERVGLESKQPIEGGGALAILVEKDWACMKPRGEDGDEDAFPNPNARR